MTRNPNILRRSLTNDRIDHLEGLTETAIGKGKLAFSA